MILDNGISFHTSATDEHWTEISTDISTLSTNCPHCSLVPSLSLPSPPLTVELSPVTCTVCTFTGISSCYQNVGQKCVADYNGASAG